jgi:hypothetical protein
VALPVTAGAAVTSYALIAELSELNCVLYFLKVSSLDCSSALTHTARIGIRLFVAFRRHVILNKITGVFTMLTTTTCVGADLATFIPDYDHSGNTVVTWASTATSAAATNA